MLTAYPPLGITGILRQYNEDFCVTEQLGFEPSGEGEHVFLWVEKHGANTEWVAKQIAHYVNISPRDVSFAGVKDRHAITQQWFSVWIKNKPEPDWLHIDNPEFKILKSVRHARKIKRGVLKGNHFKIMLRDIQYQGNKEDLQANIQQRMSLLAEGVPNYFGEQRFGHNNITKLKAWLSGQYRPKKSEQSWLLSSARAEIFNQILEKRILDQTWQTVLTDDIMMLNGSQSIFTVDDIHTAQKRFLEKDIHITGSLYGSQLIEQKEEPLEPREKLEYKLYQHNFDLCAGLDKNKLKSARRALRSIPENLSFKFDANTNQLELSFYLSAGCYATAVLRELVGYQ